MLKKKSIVNSLPKNGSEIIASEDVEEFEPLTITLNPENQHYNNPEHRFVLITAEVYKALKNLESSSFILYPEYSSQSRLHFHGVIWIRDKLMFYERDVARLICIGHIEIDDMSDPAYWQQYCEKNVKMMKSRTEINPYYDKEGSLKINDAEKYLNMLEKGIVKEETKKGVEEERESEEEDTTSEESTD